MGQTMTDVAYRFLSKRKKEVEFQKLWTEVAEAMDIPEEKKSRKKSQFYSELMMDSRFASFADNKWDLRTRRRFEEVHIETKDLELDDEDGETLRDEETGLDLPKGDDAY